MDTTRRIARLAWVSFLLAGLVTACGPKPASPGDSIATPAEPATASSKEFGDYVLHFNAIRTDSLTPEIATSYGIVRSANRALLNISMVKKVEGSTGTPVAGAVTAEAVNLNGQFKDLTLREVREGEAVYYIDDVAIAGDETLVFTVSATPENTTTPFRVKFQRQFVSE